MDWDRFKKRILGQLGKEYSFGAKWPLKEDPSGPIDCSGLTKWAYGMENITIPDGSAAQFAASEFEQDPVLGNLGFFKHINGDIHHVGILIDGQSVIEARGYPFSKVILRPRKIWEGWPEFTGWYTPKALNAA